MCDPSKRLRQLHVLVFSVCCMLGGSTERALGAEGDRALASVAPDWPQWRGPRRDGISTERGLLPQWPDGGPPLSWSATGLGAGYGSPIIVGDSIYITGDVGDESMVVALGLDGSERWRKANGVGWKRSFPGSRSTCCYDEGRLYVMNAQGRLACLSADDGSQLWAVNVFERFESANITWGISESVLVDGKAVFVTPVGQKALMAALDKLTGETLWATPTLPGEEVSYASAILVDVGGRRQLINCGAHYVFGVDAGSGALLWQHPHSVPGWAVGASPVFRDTSIYVSNADKDVGNVFRLDIGGEGPRQVWVCDMGNTHNGNIVCVDGMVFGSRKRTLKGWMGVSAETGQILASDMSLNSGSVIYADGRFYCFTDQGVLMLVDVTDGAVKTVGSVQVAKTKGDGWAHPVICHGRLYVRYHDQLTCYDIRQERP